MDDEKKEKFLSYLYETLQNTRTLLLRCKLQLTTYVIVRF